MKHRWPLVAAGLVAAVTAVILVVTMRESESQPAPGAARSAEIDRPTRVDGKPIPKVDLKKPVEMVMTESGLRPKRARPPREKIDPRNGSLQREIVDAIPDPEGEAREELKYRKSRLRLVLSDEAAQCYRGGDSKEEIELEYTLIVEKEIIRTENVRVKQSGLTDPKVERCIIDTVKDLRGFADRIPDLREEQGLTMSMHDLYVRNRGFAEDKSEDPKEAHDLPTAKPPGAK